MKARWRELWGWAWPLSVGGLTAIGLVASIMWALTGSLVQWSILDLPAWVQAIGSVAAIIAAIVIDRGSARRAREARTAETAERDAARREAIEFAYTTLSTCGEYLSSVAAAAAKDTAQFYLAPPMVEMHRGELQKAKVLVDHHLAIPAGSARSTMALAVTSPELEFAIAALVRLKANITPSGLYAAERSVRDAVHEVETMRREL